MGSGKVVSIIVGTGMVFGAYAQVQQPQPTIDELKTALAVTEGQRNLANSQYASLLASAESQLKAANAQIEKLKKEAASCKPEAKKDDKK